MNEHKKWLANFTVGVQFPSVSGFEILEMLQARSHFTQFENSMKVTELESADATFLAHANEFYSPLSEIADFGTLRAQANARPSHWWWHLDKLVKQKLQVVEM